VWDEQSDFADDFGRFQSAVPRGNNSLAGALSDFGVPGSIDAASALAFGDACLASDPMLVDWTSLHEFRHELERITTPTLVVHGELDPYTTAQTQRTLLCRLGSSERAYLTIPESDHAVHLLAHKAVLVRAVTAFVARPRTGAGRATAVVQPQPSPCDLALELAAERSVGSALTSPQRSSVVQSLWAEVSDSDGLAALRHHAAIRSNFRRIVRRALVSTRSGGPDPR
jgi:hypothetical protein